MGWSGGFSWEICLRTQAQILLVAGVMKMSATKFLVADGIAAFFTIALWGGIGYLGGNSLQVLKKDVTRIEHIAVVVLVLLLAWGIFFWYFKDKWKFKQKGISEG
jgi:membrane protein DedA with SNARE-associated domain